MYLLSKNHVKSILHAIPSLIAIIILGVIRTEANIYGPISQNHFMLMTLIPGVLFAYLSDQHFRKYTFIISQMLGIIGGIVLTIVGFKFWAVVFIALVFNPLPVARAAFLDNFPQVSALKVIAITFIAQYIPLAFDSIFQTIPYEKVIFWSLIILSINVFFSIFWFRDKFDTPRPTPSFIHMGKNTSSIFVFLIAFIFAETNFYILWDFLDMNPMFNGSLSKNTASTLLGVSLAALYTRLPHKSVITLAYSIGAGMAFLAFIHCNHNTCAADFVDSMKYYSLIGGLYLPFVADGVIGMLPKYKAMGAASIEFSDVIATILASLIFSHGTYQISILMLVVTVLFAIATGLQRYAEEIKTQH